MIWKQIWMCCFLKGGQKLDCKPCCSMLCVWCYFGIHCEALASQRFEFCCECSSTTLNLAGAVMWNAAAPADARAAPGAPRCVLSCLCPAILLLDVGSHIAAAVAWQGAPPCFCSILCLELLSKLAAMLLCSLTKYWQQRSPDTFILSEWPAWSSCVCTAVTEGWHRTSMVVGKAGLQLVSAVLGWGHVVTTSSQQSLSIFPLCWVSQSCV